LLPATAAQELLPASQAGRRRFDPGRPLSLRPPSHLVLERAGQRVPRRRHLDNPDGTRMVTPGDLMTTLAAFISQRYP
jgi:hypothetical protein